MPIEQVQYFFESDGTPSIGWEVATGTVQQALSQCYTGMLELRTDELAIEPLELLGQTCTLMLERKDQQTRIYGIVSEVEEGSTDPDQTTVQITMVPALQALHQRKNTRIFQDKTVPQILEQVLGEALEPWGRSAKQELIRTYLICEYRVQYDETDLAFCERLMHEEGIVYWFDQDGPEVVVLADHVGAYRQADLFEDTLPVTLYNSGGMDGHECVRDFTALSGLKPTKSTTRHFDWTHPSTPIKTESAVPPAGGRPHGAKVGPEREIYDHDKQPLTLADYSARKGYGKNDAQNITTIRREEQHHDGFVGKGLCTATGFMPGAKFNITGNIQGVLDGEYVLSRVTHTILTGDNTTDAYSNHFECIPPNVIWRPERIDPYEKPKVSGIQTATVVGPAGQEIHTDEHGRVRVQFHWDREGQMDENSSCFIRVQQAWAGKGWGFNFLPRIGMEVIVQFVNGDPDRPIITGCLYNGDNPTPYKLPEEMTKSTIKSNSTIGGGGFNEFRFEDKKNQEEIYTHAEKDYNEVVEHDHNTTVHNCQTNTVDINQTEFVGINQSMTVGVNRSKNIGVNETTSVGVDRTESVGNDERITIGRDKLDTIGRNVQIEITKDLLENVNNHRKEYTYADHWEEVGGSYEHKIKGRYDLEVGETIFNRTNKHILHAGKKFVIAGPGGTITIDDAGITLEGKVINVLGNAINFGSGAPGQVKVLEEAANKGLPFCEECAKKKEEKEEGGQ